MPLITASYIVATLIAVWLAPRRGYWRWLGLVFGVLMGPVAILALYILPKRQRKARGRAVTPRPVPRKP